MNILEEIKSPEVKIPVFDSDTEDHLRLMESVGIQLVETPKEEKLIDRIYKVCKKYDLKCLSLSDYKKLIPIENLQEIIKYKEKLKHYNTNLVIIAPAEDFRNVSMSVKKVDPVVIDLRSDQIVTTWGNDFTFFRRIRGFWTTPIIKMIRRCLVYPLLMILLASIISSTLAFILSVSSMVSLVIVSAISLGNELDNVYGWDKKDYVTNFYPKIPWWF